MHRHRRKRSQTEEVTLNLAAMLDMAFQLLAFFILTFKPNPVEGQISLNLPPAVHSGGSESPIDPPDPPPGDPLSARTLTITIAATANGQVASINVGLARLFDGPLDDGRLQRLQRRLREVFAVDDAFDHVVLRVGKSLNYGELMKIVDVCSRTKMSDGTLVNKIRFEALPER